MYQYIPFHTDFQLSFYLLASFLSMSIFGYLEFSYSTFLSFYCDLFEVTVLSYYLWVW